MSNALPDPAGTAPDLAATLEGLAEQAGLEGYQGLQDACLLLLEALGERESDPDFLARLAAWPALASAYLSGTAAAGGLAGYLRHPDLGLPLGEEEFGFLESMLREDAAARREAPAEPAPEPPELVPEPAGLPAEPEAAPAETRAALLERLPRAARELVELLLLQADTLFGELRALPVGDPAAAAEELRHVREDFELFANASRTVGFHGLVRLCERVDANLEHWLEGREAVTGAAVGLLLDWVGRVQTFLPAFVDPGAGEGLVAHLQDPRWPLPLPPETTADILAQIHGPDSFEWAEEVPSRPQSADAEDVSLDLPGDVNRELLDILLQELPVHTRQFSESVQALAAGGGREDLEVAQRIAHTLKGSANTVGIRGVAVLTHHLEDILLAAAKADRLPGPALHQTLIEAADCLEAMTEALLGQGEPTLEALGVLQEVLDWANRIDRQGFPEAEEPAPARPPLEPEDTAAPAAAAPEPAVGTGPAPAPSAQTATVRVATGQIENLFRLSGESIILNGQAHERQRRMKEQLQAMQAQFEILRQLGAELEELIDVKDLSGLTRRAAGPDFDTLEMDQYNELHTASRRMVEAAVDAREMSLDARKELDYLDEVLEYQQRLVIDMQEALMRTRLVPVASLVPRLQRSLRQTCRFTGKPAELAVSGEHLLIDGDILNALADPLMHVLRNAVDHGLESEAERLALGKPRQGRITIDFDREGNHIMARCRDDGRGLDLAAIRAAAEQRGLLQPGQEIADEDLRRFILRPNFSTRAQSTQTSGRGIGMDAVRTQAIALGGTLVLDAPAGQGLTVELRVPLPLSRSHALLAHVGALRVAITNKGITQVFYAGVGELRHLAGEPVLLLEDEIYPALRLGDLLRATEHRHEPRPHGAILMVQGEDRTTAVLVDSITDSRDVVIKSLGHYLGKIPGIVGATILGDGSVTPVIDIPELLRMPGRGAATLSAAAEERLPAAPDLPLVLVVDDSLSNRRALEQLVADAGYRARVARDGVEAAELLTQVKPAIVLTDLEMPRMNGIELAEHIRAQPGGKALPIVMITSRTTQRHRQLAEAAGIDAYFTKPVRDDDLLDKLRLLLESAPVQAWGAAG